MDQITLLINFKSQKIEIEMEKENTIYNLKQKLEELTGVLIKRQKIIGFKLSGKMPDDSIKLSDSKLVISKKIMLIGTPEKVVQEIQQVPDDLPEIINDLEYDYYPSQKDEEAFHQDSRVQELLKKRIETVNIQPISEMRKNVKLLVLDIDHTIFHLGGKGTTIAELTRPYLHYFLKRISPLYDICIWSQTSWKWIEAKCYEMNLFSNPDIKITFIMDTSSMIKIKSNHLENDHDHYVKPLEIIWAKLPEFYSPKNTIHVDDLSRNFVLNPKNGLKIKSFDKLEGPSDDQELLYLTEYLEYIAKYADDFTKLSHENWKTFLKSIGQRMIRNTNQN
ncbi:ubiquitin-like domain-containing ctd phosphatase 1 [Anaeramoeba ignava]|uniref:protein-serine/threonine phosphatase n=1 Tax=Anaeramoeba ignava TaxID=1746090 RepID=A0A9Q0LP82_ANAIG|nr:ubiquitin-like domain-containing ctd phosphatase 1 [Anaeramoeba ignava]